MNVLFPDVESIQALTRGEPIVGVEEGELAHFASDEGDVLMLGVLASSVNHRVPGVMVAFTTPAESGWHEHLRQVAVGMLAEFGPECGYKPSRGYRHHYTPETPFPDDAMQSAVHLPDASVIFSPADVEGLGVIRIMWNREDMLGHRAGILAATQLLEQGTPAIQDAADEIAGLHIPELERAAFLAA